RLRARHAVAGEPAEAVPAPGGPRAAGTHRAAPEHPPRPGAGAAGEARHRPADLPGVERVAASPSHHDRRTLVTILEAMADPALFGSAFPQTESWGAWRAFLAACFGLPMTNGQDALYRQHTRLQMPPTDPSRE